MACPGATWSAGLMPAALGGRCCREIINAKPTHGWLIRFPPICGSPIPVIRSPNGSKIGEWNRIMVVGWRGAWQAAWVRGMRRLAGWC